MRNTRKKKCSKCEFPPPDATCACFPNHVTVSLGDPVSLENLELKTHMNRAFQFFSSSSTEVDCTDRETNVLSVSCSNLLVDLAILFPPLLALAIL